MPTDPRRRQHPVDRVPRRRGSPRPETVHGVPGAPLAHGPHLPRERKPRAHGPGSLRPRPTHRASTRATHRGVPKPPAVALDLKESAEEAVRAPSGDIKQLCANCPACPSSPDGGRSWCRGPIHTGNKGASVTPGRARRGQRDSVSRVRGRGRRSQPQSAGVLLGWR